MNTFRIFMYLGLACLVGVILMAADHIDAPAVTEEPTDIADFYAFQSPTDNSRMAFVATTQGLLSPSSTGTASFSENVLIEINIDNTGDNVEDLVIQAIPRDGKMYFFGPYAPNEDGLMATINEGELSASVDITSYGNSANVVTENGISVFAGPRDDPFFFDLGAYMDILAGNASSFSDPGTDTFAGTNVLAIVVEVPKSMLGSSDTINTWVTTSTQ